MQLSTLMRLPNWSGTTHFRDIDRTVNLKVSNTGEALVFRYNSATYFIEDQDVSADVDGIMTVSVRSKNRMARGLARLQRVQLLDNNSRVIRANALNTLLPIRPQQAVHKDTYHALVA